VAEPLQVHDTWFPLGLKGTSSADFSFEETFVPTGFTSRSAQSVRGGPLYRLGYGGAVHEHGIFACALAQAALDSLLYNSPAKNPATLTQKSWSIAKPLIPQWPKPN
jgi:alkylation response protein AidB-like acyl-CoA dehydrogenase